MTYSYAILMVSPETYKEIREALSSAGYSDQFIDKAPCREVINMHGLALEEHPGRCEHETLIVDHSAGPGTGYRKVCGASLCKCDLCGTKWCLDHHTNPLVCPGCGVRP